MASKKDKVLQSFWVLPELPKARLKASAQLSWLFRGCPLAKTTRTGLP